MFDKSQRGHGGWRYETFAGNGDAQEWQEYQAEINRDRWREYGIDPNWLPPLFHEDENEID